MINKIEFQTNYYANPDGSGRRVEQIAMHIMDMWFYKDINCQRDEYLARRLAEQQGVTLHDMREGANAPEPLTPQEQEEFAESLRVFTGGYATNEPDQWSEIRRRVAKAAERAHQSSQNASGMKVNDEIGACVSFEYPNHD